MDLVEDLLFGGPGSQDFTNERWLEDVDDEHMFDVFDSEYETDDDLFDTQHAVSTDSRQSFSSPLLTSTNTIVETPEDLLMEDSICSAGGAAVAVAVSEELPRDRWRDKTFKMGHTLTLQQALGHRSS